MDQIEFALLEKCDLSRATEVIEEACAGLGLTIAMKGSLKAWPSCVHWHYRNGREKGTLELTLLVRERRIWANVHANRQGAWIAATLPRLRKRVERLLNAE